MSEKRENELLVDIAKLLKKYGPDTFERLAIQLDNPEFLENLSSILFSFAKHGRAISTQAKATTGKYKSKRDYRLQLIKLKETEPEKFRLLIQVYDKLIEKSVLPSLREVQAFLSDHGVKPPTVKSRDKSIVPLMDVLTSLHINKLKSWIDDIPAIDNQQDRSLEGWASLILDKERRQRKD